MQTTEQPKSPILSYHGDSTLKARFVGHVEAHREADRVMQGNYGTLVDGKWRGCAVACSLRSLDEISGVASTDSMREYGSHSDLAERLGIPLVLARLEDRIFEGLPIEWAKHWPTRFAKAIPIGADLSLVWPKFALALLTDPEMGVIGFTKREQAKAAIQGVASLFAARISGSNPSAAQWREARKNADAYAADAYAAYAAAAYAADAADAAYAAYAAYAYAAAYATAADAYAYAAAAAAASRQAYYVKMADKLIQILEEA